MTKPSQGTKPRRKTRIVFVMAAGLFTCACDVPLVHHRAQARVFIPPPPPKPPAIEPTPEIPQAPGAEAIDTAPPGAIASNNAGTATNLVDLAPPPPAPVKRPPPAPPKVQATTAPAPEPPTVVPPKLGQIFTREQYSQYNQLLAESFARVDTALARLEGKRLTAEQAETAERIRTFRRQAEQAREQDLVTAVSLARRADLLAKDLLGRLP